MESKKRRTKKKSKAKTRKEKERKIMRRALKNRHGTSCRDEWDQGKRFMRRDDNDDDDKGSCAPLLKVENEKWFIEVDNKYHTLRQ